MGNCFSRPGLQAELLAAHKDGEGVRLKLRHLQEDISIFKQKNTELGEELAKKSGKFYLQTRIT